MNPDSIAKIILIASDAGFQALPGERPEQSAYRFMQDPVLGPIIKRAVPDAASSPTPTPFTGIVPVRSNLSSQQQVALHSGHVPTPPDQAWTPPPTPSPVVPQVTDPRWPPFPPAPLQAWTPGTPPTSAVAASGAAAPATSAPSEPVRPGFIPYTQAWGMATSGDSTKKDIGAITAEYNKIAQDQMQAAYARAYAAGEQARVQAGTDAYNKAKAFYNPGEDDAAREQRALQASNAAYSAPGTDPTDLAEQALTGTEKYYESGLTGLRQTLPTGGGGGGGGGDPYATSREARAQAEFERTGVWHDEETAYRTGRDVVTDANRAEDVQYRNAQAAEQKGQHNDTLQMQFLNNLFEGAKSGGYAAPGSDYAAGGEPGGALDQLFQTLGMSRTARVAPQLPDAASLQAVMPRAMQGGAGQANLMTALAGGQ